MATLGFKKIVKREIVSNNIRLTDDNGVRYHALNNRIIGKDCFYDDQLQRWYTEYKNITPEKTMTNANRDMNTFSNSYRNGLSDEKRVIAFLAAQGLNVTPSSKEDNMKKDIDCYIDGIGYSIKAEHKGLQYGNIYFELSQQLTATGQWVDEGWYYTGEAEYYLILQGQELRLYSKRAIKDFIEANGFVRVRSLSANVKRSQGGTYRYMDTRSGYLERKDVPFISSWTLA